MRRAVEEEQEQGRDDDAERARDRLRFPFLLTFPVLI